MADRFSRAAEALAKGHITLQQAKVLAGVSPVTHEQRQASFNALAADIYQRRAKARAAYAFNGVVPIEDDENDEDNSPPPPANTGDVYALRKQQRQRNQFS